MPRPRRKGPELKQRSNGVFYAGEFSVKEGRTVWTSLHTKDDDEARQRYAKYLIEGPDKARPGLDAGVTVSQVLDWYIRDHVKPKVVDKQRQLDAIASLEAHFGDMLVKDVDVAASQVYAEARRRGIVKPTFRYVYLSDDSIVKRERRRTGVPGSDGTIRRELHALVAAVNKAIYLKKLPRDHSLQIELPVEPPANAAWLTKTQITKALDAANGNLRDFILLAYYTAARRRSIEYLKKAQVDLKHGRINLQPVESPLTKKRKPIVPVYAEIRPTLERLMAESDTEYVFGKPQDFYRPFAELMADLGIEAHPHMLRHSRATHMLMDGEDPYKVAKLLGDTLQTVERVYGHASVDYLETTSGLGAA